MDAADAISALERIRKRVEVLYREAVRYRMESPSAFAKDRELEVAAEIEALDVSLDLWMAAARERKAQ